MPPLALNWKNRTMYGQPHVYCLCLSLSGENLLAIIGTASRDLERGKRAEHRLDSSRLFFFLHFLRIVDSGASTQWENQKTQFVNHYEYHLKKWWSDVECIVTKPLSNCCGEIWKAHKIYWVVFTCGSLEVFRQKEYGAVSKTSNESRTGIIHHYAGLRKTLAPSLCDHNGSLCAVNFAMSSPELARTSFAEISPAFAYAMRSRVWTGFSNGSN